MKKQKAEQKSLTAILNQLVDDFKIVSLRGKELKRVVLDKTVNLDIDDDDVSSDISKNGNKYFYTTTSSGIRVFLPRDWEEDSELYEGDMIVVREGPRKDLDGNLLKSISIERGTEEEEE